MTARKASSGRAFKVGLFVFIGLVATTFIVFLIGENRRVWDRKVDYHATYNDVGGLKPGSAVRFGGIDVGSAGSVRHSDNPNDPKIYVDLSVSKNVAGRIRRGTVARIASKGLLGDKMIELGQLDPSQPVPPTITVSPEVRAMSKAQLKTWLEERLPEDGYLLTEESEDIGQMVNEAKDIARQAKATMANIERLSESLGDPQTAEDVRESMHALRTILDGIALKDGVAHRMIFDPEEAKHVDRILTNVESATAHMNVVAADVQDMTTRAKTGPGLVHSVVYDDQMAQGVTGAAVELQKSLQAVRTGNGIAHALVYGDDSTQHVMGNVSAMSDDMREIVANVKAGRGTLGALLVDPSVYEDVKSLVGNVERNQVLRALVRYSIKQNEEQRPHATVSDQPAATNGNGKVNANANEAH